MAGTTVYTLAAGAAATAAQPIQAGQYMFMAEATWGGGTVVVQMKSPNGTFISVNTNGSLSANGMLLVNLPAGLVQAVITTATAVYAYLITVPTITTR